MADTWMTVEQAAVTLGLSVRTVNRHVNLGKLESRLFQGRREVLVALPLESVQTAGTFYEHGNNPSISPSPSHLGNSADGDDGSPEISPAVNPPLSSRSDLPFPTSDRFDSANDPTALAIAQLADKNADMAAAIYQTLAKSAERQVSALRRSNYIAWGVTTLLAIAVMIAIGWTTHRLTRVQDAFEQSGHEAKRSMELAANAAQQAESARRQLSAVEQRAAVDESQLELMRQIISERRQPDTRPSFVQRLGSYFHP